MDEIWRDITGYEGYYQVSNLGRVKRLLTRVNSNKGGRTVCEKILCQCSNRGYMVVHVCMFNKRRKLKVHRLVAEAFLPNPSSLPCVNHKDEDKTNNFVWVNEDGAVDPERSNLEWCTTEYNNNYGTHQQRSAYTRKQKISVYENGVLLKSYDSITSASEDLGIHRTYFFKYLQRHGYTYSKI